MKIVIILGHFFVIPSAHTMKLASYFFFRAIFIDIFVVPLWVREVYVHGVLLFTYCVCMQAFLLKEAIMPSICKWAICPLVSWNMR